MSKKIAMQCCISRFPPPPPPPPPQSVRSNYHNIDATAFAMFATVVYLPTCQKQKVGQK